MALLIFLILVFVISLSGALQPGPVTATALTIGTRNKYAGALMAVGHGIIEFPLMILIMLGLDKIFKLPAFSIGIGLGGGAILMMMAWQMFRSSKNPDNSNAEPTKDRPILAGVVLSASNPYFLLWWATIGLKLASDAREFGVWAFGLFAITHWLCDCTWFQMLSWGSFKGATLLGPKSFGIVLQVCSAAMFTFGLKFFYDSAVLLASLI